MNIRAATLLLMMVIFAAFPGILRADTAEVLPKGVSLIALDSQLYFPVDEQYDPDGEAEDVAANFNANLNSAVFPDLALVEAGFMMPPGSATLGSSVVSFEYEIYEFDFKFYYGITDRLTAGIKVPYWVMKNKVDAKVDSSKATVGSNPYLGTPGDPFGGAPFIPVSLGGQPLTSDDVQELLVREYGFKRIESWSKDGLSDIEVGAKYQYLNSKNWRLAFTAGVILPTGDVDDPDNLVDRGFGSGAYAPFLYLQHDYMGFRNLLLNLTLKYKLYLPDHEELRVPENPNRPITANKERVDRDLGDVFEAEVECQYRFTDWLSGFALYKYGQRLKDRISGDGGFNYEALEHETNATQHVAKIGLTYSTISLYKEKKFPLPMTVSISYRNRFAGSNNVLKSEYIGLGVSVYF